MVATPRPLDRTREAMHPDLKVDKVKISLSSTGPTLVRIEVKTDGGLTNFMYRDIWCTFSNNAQDRHSRLFPLSKGAGKKKIRKEQAYPPDKTFEHVEHVR